MLWLKRNGRFNELYKCKISDEWIAPGDFYYEDDTDGLIVKATVYKKMQEKMEQDKFDYSKLEQAKSQLDYEAQLKKAEKEFLTQTIFERQVAGKGDAR